MRLLACMIVAMALILVADIAPAAEQPGAKLQDVERALDAGKKQRDALKKKSGDLAAELQSLKVATVKAAALIQNHEASVLELEARIKRLSEISREKTQRLQARRGQFGRVLQALLRMARHPPEAMIAAPVTPSEMVRGAILLRAAVPEIERRADALRDDLESLFRAGQQATERRQQLALEMTGLAEQRSNLGQLMARKTTLKSQADTETQKAERRVRALANEAKSLRELMEKLQADRQSREAKAKITEKKDTKKKTQVASLPALAKPADPISGAKGRLPYPVVGSLVGRYGQTMETGLTRKGITIEARPGSQVVAPYDGQVVFAGPFKGYGQLLIIEHDEGYHSLLAGVTRIDSVIGQHVLSGEPVGIMGSPADGFPILYVELRRNGQPINPVPWLAARKAKVSG